MSEDNGPVHDDEAFSPPPGSGEQPSPTAEDLAIGKAKREAAAARIREIRRKGQERIDRMFADHLADHGEVTVTSSEDFLREVDGVDHSETGKE